MTASEETAVQTCPRRMQEMGSWERAENLDRWDERPTGLSCSFCGSLHPDRFFALVREGYEVGPTDKSYKAYVKTPTGETKFYFLHLTEEQQVEFVGLLNAKQIKIGYPGRFYVLPFFVQLGPST